MEHVKKSTTEIYSDTIIMALIDAASKTGVADYNAALAALTNAQAYLIAKLPPEVRRQTFGECGIALRQQTAAFAAIKAGGGQ